MYLKKWLLATSFILIIISCKEPQKNYATFSGNITNKNSDSLLIRSNERPFYKVIKVNEDGSFKDTLKVEPGVYNLFDGEEYTNLFLKNGHDIHLALDTKNFDESITYTGEGAQHSNFIAQKYVLQSELFDLDKLKNLNATELETELSNIKQELKTFYTSDKTIDSSLIALAVNEIDPLIQQFRNYLGQAIDLKTQFPKGSKSPTFEDYENYNGSKTSLSELKGKYVYIDVWATWCGPCKVEIPSLKSLEKEYGGKNIQFVSISIDDNMSHNSWEDAKESWRNMIQEKELRGIQLLAPKGGQSDFVQDYKISGIPRFILIDPNGNIVDADAPRPSDPNLVALFNELNI
ncbi:TlpA family protein disulfide reductase [Flavobacteriaceae bacterium XHP0103]|uniref:TlpA family protein disulfide reductase n=1 Tax=Marixanthotalea marina TaxID=2844359 RepID=UPI002989B500|nr:TlpA disulfide reductase family protein [Marixanthotalea marina]MBU3823118.1 TlpA family protein disulfide reductase [Marixanthotalea marina]